MITIEDALENFLLDTRSRLSANTTRWYRMHLREFVERHEGMAIDKVPTLAIRQYLVELRDAQSHRNGARIDPGPLSLETQRGRHRAFRTFFNWCGTEYDLDPKVNPMRKIKALHGSAHEPKAVSLDDVRKVLADIPETVGGKRDRAILYFMLDTGCRAGGIVGLTLERLDLDHRRAVVIEKGDRARVVPFTLDTATAIRDWLTVRPESAQTVFCDLGTKKLGTAITPTGLREILRRWKVRSGVDGRFNPHSFRHGYAREFLTNGGSMPALQQMLGHSSPNVTMMFYARWDINELIKQAEEHSPLQGLRK